MRGPLSTTLTACVSFNTRDIVFCSHYSRTMSAKYWVQTPSKSSKSWNSSRTIPCPRGNIPMLITLRDTLLKGSRPLPKEEPLMQTGEQRIKKALSSIFRKPFLLSRTFMMGELRVRWLKLQRKRQRVVSENFIWFQTLAIWVGSLTFLRQMWASQREQDRFLATQPTLPFLFTPKRFLEIRQINRLGMPGSFTHRSEEK